MNIGKLYIEVISTGIISELEIKWVASHQTNFSRCEEATALRLGRLIDSGYINLGCRL